MLSTEDELSINSDNMGEIAARCQPDAAENEEDQAATDDPNQLELAPEHLAPLPQVVVDEMEDLMQHGVQDDE